MNGKKQYKIKLHRKVIEIDSKKIDKVTKDKIKKKCIALLSKNPLNVGAPLRYGLNGYRKLKIFNNFRIVYRVSEEEVTVFILSVGIRRDAEVYHDAILRLKKN